MPTLQQIYTLEVDPIKYLEACSSIELIEIESLISSARFQQKMGNRDIASIKFNHVWQKEEYERLQELYQEHTAKEIAVLMNRSLLGVQRKIFDLELKKYPKRTKRQQDLNPNAKKVITGEQGQRIEKVPCLINNTFSTVNERDKANIALEQAKSIEKDHKKTKVSVRIDPRTIILTSNPKKYIIPKK